jgi:NDP-sugar pyrophosphorylase family protein
MGVYVFSKRVLDFVPTDRAFGFDDLMHALLAAQQPVNVYPHSGYWLDIGRVEDFEKANADIHHLEFCNK